MGEIIDHRTEFCIEPREMKSVLISLSVLRRNLIIDKALGITNIDLYINQSKMQFREFFFYEILKETFELKSFRNVSTDKYARSIIYSTYAREKYFYPFFCTNVFVTFLFQQLYVRVYSTSVMFAFVTNSITE